MSLSVHRYGGIQFNFRGREIGHVHGNGLLDLRFTRKLKTELVEQGIARAHHVFAETGWASFDLDGDNLDMALELCKLAQAVVEKSAPSLAEYPRSSALLAASSI